MRKLVTNIPDTFRVKAYAGTNSVLLAFDLEKSLTKDLLGFAIEQKEGNRSWQWLLNSLTFEGKEHTIKKFNATPSNLAPFQKFRWGDYNIQPGTSCKYRVHLVYKDQTSPGESLEVEIKADDGKPADQHINFNRAVAASQSFSRNFPEVDVLLKENKGLPIEEWPGKAQKWLENGLLDRILAFIKRAKDKTWALDVAIYEYELPSIVESVNKAHKDSNVRVIYHAKDPDEQTTLNEDNLKKIPVAKKRGRVTNKIFHDKFIVLSKLDTGGKRIPHAVLCGSTNFTENGIYRQANVVHVLNDKSIAAKYLELFENIWSDPKNVPATRKWITANNPVVSDDALFVGFSPRTGKADLTEFCSIINSANKDVLFATAFKLPEDILDALLGKAHDDVLRFGIQNSKSRITGFHADKSAEFTTPALLSTGLEGWVKEGLKGQRGNLLIHTKTVVANFTSDSPVVISGSHNLSVSASRDNDENYLIIRGDTDIADRYGLEILRFYEHYRFRFYAKLLKLQKVKPLANDDSWLKDYYKPGNLKELARLRFAGR